MTWFLDNSTTSCQVAFALRQACEIALSELRNDARRLGAFGDTVHMPALSAVCVNQRWGSKDS